MVGAIADIQRDDSADHHRFFALAEGYYLTPA
jgi:hypothetical protein